MSPLPPSSSVSSHITLGNLLVSNSFSMPTFFFQYTYFNKHIISISTSHYPRIRWLDHLSILMTQHALQRCPISTVMTWPVHPYYICTALTLSFLLSLQCHIYFSLPYIKQDTTILPCRLFFTFRLILLFPTTVIKTPLTLWSTSVSMRSSQLHIIPKYWYLNSSAFSISNLFRHVLFVCFCVSFNPLPYSSRHSSFNFYLYSRTLLNSSLCSCFSLSLSTAL